MRTRIGCLQAVVCLALNAALAAAKFALGWVINSIALMADGGNNLADTLANVVVLVGFKTAGKAADPRHPHGHGRMEAVTTVILTTLLVVVGLELFVESAKRLVAPQEVEPNWLVVGAVVLSAGVKEWMARFSRHLGRLIGSTALEADAWNYRCDVAASLLVAVAVAAAALHAHWLDSVFGIGVSVMIMWGGLRLLRSSASYLIGESPGEAVLREVEAAARSVPGVVATHDIEVHDYGAHKDVSLHIEIEGGATAGRAHEIADAVEAAVGARLNVVPVVHVDPCDSVPYVPPEEAVQAVIEEGLRGSGEVAGFHGVTVASTPAGEGRVHFHVVVNAEMDLARAHQLSHELSARIAERLPGYKVTIHMEPSEKRPAAASGATGSP